jgi:hypothetical protein
MADSVVRINVPLIESLVQKHFGPRFTSRLAYSTVRGRYVPSDLPRRIAAPQKLFGIRLWWTVIGEFSENLGFRLELWDAAYLAPARILVDEYNRQATATPLVLSHPASPAAAQGFALA